MKRNNRRLLIITASFFCWLFIFILGAKLGLNRGMGSFTWQEIYNDLHVFLLMALFGTIVMTLGSYVNKYGKK